MQFHHLRHVRLHKYNGLFGTNAGRQPVEHHFHWYSASSPGLSPPSSARGHPRYSRHNHSHPATRHNSGSRPDSSPDVGDLSVEPPKTHVLFLPFITSLSGGRDASSRDHKFFKQFFIGLGMAWENTRPTRPTEFYSPTSFRTSPSTSPGSAWRWAAQFGI